MPVEGRDLSSRAAHDGGRDMRTGKSLTASEGVQRLQTALHAKAKEAPCFRFYSLSDRRMRQWLCRKHKVRTGKDVRCRLSLQSVSFWFESRA